MSDGSQLRQSWYSALNDAEAQFRQLLTSPAAEWKRLSHSADVISAKQKGKGRVSSVPELADVIVHRNSTKSGEDVYRMVLDVPTNDEQVSLEPWKAVLTTPELRQEWDPAVEDAHLLEMFDRNTRISKTNYSLGWPANPRDSITISRAFHDTTTLIDITTSLPRSTDEPVYLRPSPPFVRSHVNLFAWCIQYVQPQPPSPSDKKSGSGGRLRITCFWQHDLKALWGFGSSIATLTQQLSTMTLSLLKTVMKRGGRVPKLIGYGNGISIERVRYQIDREALSVDYAIIPDDDEHHELGLQGMDEVHALREHRRLTRSIECVLPSLEGWDVQVTMKGSSEEVEKIPWSAHAVRTSSNSSTFSPPDQVLLRLAHGALTDEDAVLKIKVVIEVSGGTRGLRLNGLQTKIHDLEERDPSSYAIPQKMLQDVASAVDLSIQTSSSLGTVSSNASSSNGLPSVRPNPERTPVAEKSILSKVRRNYIYFSSLLQEPEAKWKRTTEARGVSITQLDSIDPTLVVYRAEATFVGVGLWDLYGAVVSPGARIYWDKQHEDGTLLEHVNELTELWHFKTKPAWPVNGRDAVVLKTVYKSPTTIHVFSFSADDPHLFPHVPSADPNVIRTQVDLQGWAIEALSPTTTLLTLLEQSDPKGWTNKASIPTTMINTLAGIGDFAIKCGGPPIVTRMAGAKANELRYDHERGTFKVEYEPCANRGSASSTPNGSSQDQDDSGLPAIECEIRCDIDTWAASLDIVVDPPPQTITCLRRHRLSADGGGLWLTLSHDAIFLDDERLLVLVRRAPGKEKGLVMVNGAKVQIDVEELPDHEIKTLSRQKRVKPPRIPLDQPPVMSIIRRRKAEWGGAEAEESGENKGDADGAGSSSTSSVPKISSPLSRFFTYAVDQATTTTQQAVAAISPANAAGGSSALDPAKPPMQHALEALAWTQDFNSRPFVQEGWTMVGDKGLVVQRKLIPEISPFIPVHRGFKVIEGVSAEELASVVTEYDCRKTWDERFDSARVLESYGGQARTTFLVAKGGFPFRDRGFYLASVMAREHIPSFGSVSSSRRNTEEMADQSPTARNAIFCVSASFSADSDSTKTFSADKYNPYVLPIGRVYLDAWILETLDPYTKENYAIPSARCTRLVAVDYAGSIPAAFNSMINATLARGVLAVEMYMKSGGVKAALPLTRLPANGLVVSEKREEEERGLGSATTVTCIPEGEGSSSVLGAAAEGGWRLRKRDENRMLLETKFDVEKKVYRSSVLVVLPPPKQPQPAVATPLSHAHGKEESTATVIANASAGDPNATTAAENDKEISTTSITPRPSRLPLGSPSPHRRDGERQRLPSDASLSNTVHSAGSEATLMGPEQSHDFDHDHDASAMSSSTSIALTPMPPMPGSMIVTPAPTAFPSLNPPHNHKIANNTNTTALRASTSVSPTRPPLSHSPHSHGRQSSSSASLSASPPKMRQRAASSSSGLLSGHGYSQSQTPYFSPPLPSSSSSSAAQLQPVVRGRTTSAAVLHRSTSKAKITRPKEGNGDLVLMEVVVDSRMFCAAGATANAKAIASGSGKGYRVDVKARRRDALKAENLEAIGLNKLDSGFDSGPTATTTTTTTDASSSSLSNANANIEMPFITTLYTLPSSPLHSSSLSECDGPGDARAMRHLIRVSLPTWKYCRHQHMEEDKDEGWEDPLMQRPVSVSEKDKDREKNKAAKEKDRDKEKEKEGRPEWLDVLEKTGVVVDLVVSPLPGGGTSGSSVSSGSASKGTSKTGKGGGMVVRVNGEEKRVLGEKESLSSLGREELVDDRVGRMGVLVRTKTPNESETMPEELKAPVGVADDLLVPLPPPSSIILGSSDSGLLGSGSGARGGMVGDKDSAAAAKGEGEGGEKGKGKEGVSEGKFRNGEDSPIGMPKSSEGAGGGPPLGNQVGPASSTAGPGGFLGFGFLGVNMNPLVRFGSGGGVKDDANPASTGDEQTSGIKLARPQHEDSKKNSNSDSASGINNTKARSASTVTATQETTGGPGPSTSTTSTLSAGQGMGLGRGLYPLSTVLLVGLIAFLIGSLLRSLLSPADFIYVVTGEDMGGKREGWREIRRLLEIKYLAGGWDFQVAVVRRH